MRLDLFPRTYPGSSWNVPVGPSASRVARRTTVLALSSGDLPAAISSTAPQLGGALGIALLGSVITATYRAELSTAVVPDDSARDSLSAAVALAHRLPAAGDGGRGAHAAGWCGEAHHGSG
ncbi:hypothetical protein [Nonomuraea jabiensis]|uniref:hypothetical protein n=1 Tax=Nonomuraea jabiensis TaxID=882448 RepID=UPI003D70FB0D